MMGEQIGGDTTGSVSTEPGSAEQLRREAAKARTLADAAFGEEERRQLGEVAVTLEREANAIEATLARKPRSS